LGSVWLYFLKKPNKDGQTVASFGKKHIFAREEPEVGSQEPELGARGAL
jgi:hypothetical protein